ncbi:MAG: carboxylate--amine ligase, partial [Candidatus Riflebacteria bacterium]|nr:carboxylate--amine ligase [Candidatus Riflebacteria bacterium]
MNQFLMLSPHYPQRLFQFARYLRAAGFRVTGMGDAVWEQLQADLRANLSAYRQIDLGCYSGKGRFDEGRYDLLYRATASLIAEQGRPGWIESFNEYWLPLEARLRLEFNVPGPKPDDLEWMIRKSRMKEVFRRAGATVAPGELAVELDRVLEFLDREQTIIIKPDIGVGASDTHRIGSPEEARRFWAERDPGTRYFMERFIDGPDRELVSYDGLCDGNGDVVFATVHPCNEGLMEIVAG